MEENDIPVHSLSAKQKSLMPDAVGRPGREARLAENLLTGRQENITIIA